jgi:hypothetical protein
LDFLWVIVVIIISSTTIIIIITIIIIHGIIFSSFHDCLYALLFTIVRCKLRYISVVQNSVASAEFCSPFLFCCCCSLTEITFWRFPSYSVNAVIVVVNVPIAAAMFVIVLLLLYEYILRIGNSNTECKNINT